MPATLWLTGLSGAGKSTLAKSLELALSKRRTSCVVLDGDEVRKGLCSDLGFSARDRSENIRRIAEVAALLNRTGILAIVALISPMAADRARAREIIGPTAMHEIYVATPLHVCEARDPKGLYRKAREGSVPEFTGLTAPYEAPEQAQLVLNTEEMDPMECLHKILALVGIREVTS